MISFDNTQIAFQSKSNTELRRAYLLFSILANPKVTKLGKMITEFGIKLHLPIKPIIKNTIYRQFVGGENINDCSRVIEALAQYGIGTILDYSVEGKADEKTFELAMNEILETIKKANENEKIPFAVFKISGVASSEILEKVSLNQTLNTNEMEAFSRIKQRVLKICQSAYETGTPLFIDAEESWIQPAINQIAEEMMLQFNREKAIIYNTIQLYLKSGYPYLQKLIDKAKKNNFFVGVKLVRGAYLEKERKRAKEMGYTDPTQPNKEATDNHFDLSLRLCIENIQIVSLCAGTHNEKSSQLLAQLIQEKNLSPQDSRIFFAQLLGMSDHISYNLAHHGYNVAKYVPYGPVSDVIPYLFRRAEENTSVKGQTGRELSLLKKELKRRKKARQK